MILSSHSGRSLYPRFSRTARCVKFICGQVQIPLPQSVAYSLVRCCSSSRNLTARIRAARTISSGWTESMCCFDILLSMGLKDPGNDCEVRGQPFRHCKAKREFSESRMQTARAMVSRGRSARVRIAWTSGTEEVVREVDEGIRFVR